ncbi:DUF1971 domain-containing protein [Roseibium sp. SCPC15]|uniref:DUF1971 domain-containing protein n=1 Tax=Roseibium sp. SCP15 TaxID=3141376 RepID=UPI0033366E25
MTTLPGKAEAYHSTKVFNASTVPAKLTEQHNTKQGVWGRIEAISGRLHLTRCHGTDDGEATEIIHAGDYAVVAPQEVHFVTLEDNTEFKVTFYREPSTGSGQRA